MTDAIETAIASSLGRWREEPFVWGVNDCVLAVADYLTLLGYSDMAGRWRGRYRDRDGAQAFIEASGGHLSLVTQGMVDIGLTKRTDPPKRGDVVVAGVLGTVVLCGLHLGARTAFKDTNGYRETRRLPVLARWSPTDGKGGPCDH